MENDELNDANKPDQNFIGSAFKGNNEIIDVLKAFFKKLGSNAGFMNALSKTFLVFVTFVTIAFVFVFIIYLAPMIQEISFQGNSIPVTIEEFKLDPAYKKQIGLMTRDVQRMTRKYNSYTSGQSYVVINTTENRFLLYRNRKLIREGFCSSGSYKMLQTAEGKSWTFKTPKGKFWIHGKISNPTWRRPDWAFVEEGLPIPTANHPSRYEYGVLGDYALALGDGYLIHGTIYKRFLGMPVTHGCVRLNDEDLEVIYNTLSIGSKVYIF